MQNALFILGLALLMAGSLTASHGGVIFAQRHVLRKTEKPLSGGHYGLIAWAMAIFGLALMLGPTAFTDNLARNLAGISIATWAIWCLWWAGTAHRLRDESSYFRLHHS